MNNVTTNTSVDILRALADEVRLGMVKKIAKEMSAVSSCDVVASCESLTKLSQPTLSHHFAKLVDAGIIIQRKSGTQNVYEFNAELLMRSGIDINKL